jgi:TatA/E family protein of Tat protein translocase
MGAEWWIVIGVIVLLFGGAQLPKLARSLGEAKREFSDAVGPAAAKPDTTKSN